MSSDADIDERIVAYRSGDALVYQLSGDWKIDDTLPTIGPEEKTAGIQPLRRVLFDTTKLGTWDSCLLHFILNRFEHCRKEGLVFEAEGLPKAVNKLIALAQTETAQDRTKDQEKAAESWSVRGGILYLARLYTAVQNEIVDFIIFIGEAALSLMRLFTGRSQMRRSDFFAILQECGPNALPIVTLISFLVGVILAFLGAVVLMRFGTGIYIAYLMGSGILREMGAVMTAVIMAGRTGAAFAAEIGNMKVNEELDALKTSGISPMEFIVLPRLLALSLMLPMLTLFANTMGILGGLWIAVQTLDLSYEQYFQGLKDSVELGDFLLGIIKAGVFGVIIALSGCFRGLQCSSSSDGVGSATTSAVVTSITMIVFANAIINFVDWLLASMAFS